MKNKNHLVVRFNLKKVIPEDIRLGSKVADALDELIKKKLEKAAERARANKRTTILAQDL